MEDQPGAEPVDPPSRIMAAGTLQILLPWGQRCHLRGATSRPTTGRGWLTDRLGRTVDDEGGEAARRVGMTEEEFRSVKQHSAEHAGQGHSSVLRETLGSTSTDKCSNVADNGQLGSWRPTWCQAPWSRREWRHRCAAVQALWRQRRQLGRSGTQAPASATLPKGQSVVVFCLCARRGCLTRPGARCGPYRAPQQAKSVLFQRKAGCCWRRSCPQDPQLRRNADRLATRQLCRCRPEAERKLSGMKVAPQNTAA